jgi:predicted secreted protein
LVTDDDASLELHVSPGAVEVRLPEAPTSGFLWTLVDPPPAVSLERDDYVPPSGGAVGGRGERVFHLAVSGPGRFELEFHLRRSSEGDAAERKTVTLIVGD